MTDLESPKKNNDCYFYYYSTCAKGDSCTFRHEPSALGCETMCSFWKEGKCLNVHCNFRHMELRKNRKVIPCYWESQPVGCLKAHCPFLHQNPRPSDEVSVEKSNISAEKSNNDNESSERKVTADSLVVNFEEESDTESMPAYSPLKNGGRRVRIKSLEEIKLEKIQAEQAAFYSYSGQLPEYQPLNIDGDDLRQRIVRRITLKQISPQRTVKFTSHPINKPQTNKRLTSDEMANILGDESLRKKRKIFQQNDNENYQTTFNKSLENKVTSESNNSKSISTLRTEPEIQDIKIKTLAEIRAERIARMEDCSDNKKRTVTIEEREEAEVSSTSADENIQRDFQEVNKQNRNSEMPKRKLKLRRKLNLNDGNTELRDETVVSSNEHKEYTSETSSVYNQVFEERIREPEHSKDLTKQSSSDSDRMEEDVLLLDDDEEEYEDVTLKAEDELLEEISSFID